MVCALFGHGNTPNAIYPQLKTEMEKVPKRFAITWRNKWMVRESEMILCYINHTWGGAAQAVEYGRRQGKTVVNLGSVRFL